MLRSIKYQRPEVCVLRDFQICLDMLNLLGEERRAKFHNLVKVTIDTSLLHLLLPRLKMLVSCTFSPESQITV